MVDGIVNIEIPITVTDSLVEDGLGFFGTIGKFVNTELQINSIFRADVSLPHSTRHYDWLVTHTTGNNSASLEVGVKPLSFDVRDFVNDRLILTDFLTPKGGDIPMFVWANPTFLTDSRRDFDFAYIGQGADGIESDLIIDRVKRTRDGPNINITFSDLVNGDSFYGSTAPIVLDIGAENELYVFSLIATT